MQLGLEKLFVYHPDHGQVQPDDGDLYIEALPYTFRGGQGVDARVSA